MFVLLGALLVLMWLPDVSRAATSSVTIRDNYYQPRETRIDPGDTVVWNNQGARTHTVTSDTGDFRSGDIRRGGTFSETFNEEGYYYYHCNYHGARGQVGQWGVIIVGNPPPPPGEGPGEQDDRPKVVVPKDYKTIQKAVNVAKPGSTVVIRPGRYHEAVVVKTPRLLIRGVDRFRTILHGRDKLGTGITVDGANKVRIKNLTVRNYLGNGLFWNNVTGYQASRIDSIKNRTYGIYAFDSYDGVIKDSFGWGSGDSAFYIGQCLGCSGLIENVRSQFNYLGYSGTNATGVVIRNSLFRHNGAGIVPNTLPTEELGPNRGTLMINNRVLKNNYETVPAAGFSETVGIPFGTGIWLPGVTTNVAMNNVIRDHKSYGVLITPSIDESLPMDNEVIGNLIRNSDSDGDGYGYDLAWDGSGANNCFSNNDITGPTGPPEIQTLYNCANRPFPGVAFAPVQAHVAAAVAEVATREQKEPPEPKRPRCQRGVRGCEL